jgi:hypothetical protein
MHVDEQLTCPDRRVDVPLLVQEQTGMSDDQMATLVRMQIEPLFQRPFGEIQINTGARYRAHNGNDPGEHLPIGTYYFKDIRPGGFDRVTLDYGPAGQASGLGIFFWVQDLTGNGYPDIVAPGKEGLYLFENMGEG